MEGAHASNIHSPSSLLSRDQIKVGAQRFNSHHSIIEQAFGIMMTRVQAIFLQGAGGAPCLFPLCKPLYSGVVFKQKKMKATLIYLHSVIIQAWLHIMLTSFCMQHFLLGLVKTVCSYWDTQVGVFKYSCFSCCVVLC